MKLNHLFLLTAITSCALSRDDSGLANPLGPGQFSILLRADRPL